MYKMEPETCNYDVYFGGIDDVLSGCPPAAKNNVLKKNFKKPYISILYTSEYQNFFLQMLIIIPHHISTTMGPKT